MAAPHPVLFGLVVSGSVPWSAVTDEVLDSAVEHRLVGLLASSGHGRPTRDVLVRLTGLEMAESAHRERVLAKAASVHRRLDDAGIRHLFMKGSVEAHRLFRSPEVRRFMDVDLVIHPDESLSETISILIPGHPETNELDGLVRDGYRSSIGYFDEEIPIDVHTDALRNGPRSVDPSAWWDRVVQIDVPPIGTVEALDVNASTLLFLIHQARDRFRYLNGVWEFRRRLETGVDWNEVENLARAEGIWEQTAVAVEVLSETIGIQPPVTAPFNWRTRMWRRLWSEKVRFLGEEGRSRFNRRGTWLMPLTSHGRFGEVSRWIVRSALPPDSHLRMKHPQAKGPYLWRVVSSRARVLSARRWRVFRDSVKDRWF